MMVRCHRCNERRKPYRWDEYGEICEECAFASEQLVAYYGHKEAQAQWVRQRVRGKTQGPMRWIEVLMMEGAGAVGPAPETPIVESIQWSRQVDLFQ